MSVSGVFVPKGDLGIQIIKKDAWIPEQIRVKEYNPKTDLGRLIRDAAKYLPVEMAAALIDKVSSIVVLQSALRVVRFKNVVRSDGKLVDRRREDFGVVSEKVITTAGVNFLVDAWQNSVELETMKYHGIGTGTNAENISDTSLQTESTTALNPDSTRATGSLAEGASANVFRSVGTLTADASIACTEHGLFSQSATGGGTLWDRSVFSVINLANGDSIQITYDMTATAGG